MFKLDDVDTTPRSLLAIDGDVTRLIGIDSSILVTRTVTIADAAAVEEYIKMLFGPAD